MISCAPPTYKLSILESKFDTIIYTKNSGTTARGWVIGCEVLGSSMS